MKTTILALIVAVLILPSLISAYEGFTGGMQYYERLQTKGVGLSVQKMYDHDEGVICYIALEAISCVKDN